MIRAEKINYLLLFIISSLFVSDLFINKGEPATMDGRIHTTSITQFAESLQQGQFPIVWLNNFANYGLPVGLFSHQIPLYLGGFLEIFTHNPVLSMNIMIFLATVLANWLFYYFLRLYVSPSSALIGSILFSLAPYRILNVYIRGAMPEVLSAIFLPLILIFLYRFFVEKSTSAFFFLTLSIAGLALTHPMMLLIYSLFIIPYGIYLTVAGQQRKIGSFMQKTLLVRFFLLGSSLFLGLGLASYYLFPLFLEKKYFYFGKSTNLLTNDFLGLQNFFGSQWYYFYQNDIFTRGHVIQIGLPELIIFIVGTFFLLTGLMRKKKDKLLPFLFLSIIIGAVSLSLTTVFSKSIYSLFTILQNIQFPWRMLSIFIFIPPIIIAVISERIKIKWLLFIFIIFIAAIRFPQMYGKNYTIHPYSYYSSTLENLHSVNMNTIWTGKTEDYPARVKQAELIDGDSILTIKKSTNTYRQYIVDSSAPLRLVDYTFYFPGWKVFVDKKEIPIEFQDPRYRGIITYKVPAGRHLIEVKFTDTNVRKIAKLLSLGFAVFIIVLFIFNKYFNQKLNRYV